MLIGSGFILGLFEVILALTMVIIAYFHWSYGYWKRRNLPQIEPSFPFGNIPFPFNQKLSIGLHMASIYNQIKQQGLKHAGIYFFSSPVYYITDLDYVKDVLTKNFQFFVDRGTYYNEKHDPLSAHLFSIGGEKWHNLRMKLTPTFTSGKMKMMFQTLVECESPLHKLSQQFCDKSEPVDIKELTGRFTTDIIGSVAFGLDCNSFKEEDSPFRRYGKKIFTATPWRQLVLTFAFILPKLAKSLGVRVTPTDVADFFMKVVEDTVNYREKNGVVRQDFLQLLIELKNAQPDNEQRMHDDGKSLTINEIAAQSFLFFLAGFESSSTTMTFTLYELARNQDYQQKVRDEINEVLNKYDGRITYDGINEMKYMTQVIEEALRMYPPVPFVTRQSVKDYKVPDCDLIIETDTRVIISIYGIHHDPEYYDDPEVFDPERFSEENKQKRNPYAYLPFGQGPRHCIGLRFGMMQAKVGLTSLLKNYKFTVSDKTRQPLKMDISSFILTADGNIWLDMEKI